MPGTGKTTLARALAQEHQATYLRIDAIEQALRTSGMLAGDVGPAGYLVAYALAESNLRLGHSVVADSANAIATTREAWRRVAASAGVPIVEIELVCSDLAEHRRRIEMRANDILGLPPLDWQQIVARSYDPWDRPHIQLDTAGIPVAAALAELRRAIDCRPG